jgi:hypothetical protein
MIIPVLQEYLRASPTPEDLTGSALRLGLDQRMIYDPFRDLPYEILHRIFSFLPGDSILELIVASWPVHSVTRSNLFWKKLILSDMPWLWEFERAVIADLAGQVDFKNLYLDLNRKTKAKLNMRGPFLGLANRRRIWGVCEQLVGLYLKRTSEELGDTARRDALAIMEHSETIQMPSVLYPQRQGGTDISTQRVYSWTEIDSLMATFETVWDSSGSLIGLAITFGEDRRLFGRDDGQATARQSTLIAATDWIVGLILHIPDLDLINTFPETSIHGITVRFYQRRYESTQHT